MTRRLTRALTCHTPAAATHAAPARITIACAAMENATASALGTPLTIRSAAPAPACVAAPAGAIGNAADAAEAQRNASASGNDAPTDNACNRTKTARPRNAHDTEIKSHACD